MRATRPLLALAAAAAVALTGGCAAGAHDVAASGPVTTSIDTALAADSTTTPLRILITNDDGWDAPGIQATYAALKDAGHDVTMSAPAENQSGMSAGFEFQGTVDTTTHDSDPAMHSVTATPVGSLMFGLNELLKDTPPDLVISGTNVGTNIGADTNYSGTVGAAVVAAQVYGIPSIAISTATTGRGPDETGAYAETAALLVRILEHGIPSFPTGTVLNINYPVLKDGATEPAGYVYAPMSDKSQASIGYLDNGDGSFTLQPGRSGATPEPGSDWAQLNAGNVTFTLLKANRTADEADAASVKQLIAGLSDTPAEPSPAGSLGSGSLLGS